MSLHWLIFKYDFLYEIMWDVRVMSSNNFRIFKFCLFKGYDHYRYTSAYRKNLNKFITSCNAYRQNKCHICCHVYVFFSVILLFDLILRYLFIGMYGTFAILNNLLKFNASIHLNYKI